MTTQKINLLISQFGDFGTVSGHSQRTKTARERTIRRIHDEGINSLTCESQQIVGWIATLDVAKASRATYRSHLAAWFRWLHCHDHRPDNPMRLVPKLATPRGLPRPLAPEQIAAILAACADFRARQTRDYILLAWLAGLRNHEIAAIHGRCFNIQRKRLTITGKGGRTATIPLHPVLAELAASHPRDAHWFPSPTTQQPHVSRVSVGLAISRAFERAGVVGTPHQLRHSFGTQIYEATSDLGIAQMALRHADIRTTRGYAMVSDSRVESAVMSLWADETTWPQVA